MCEVHPCCWNHLITCVAMAACSSTWSLKSALAACSHSLKSSSHSPTPVFQVLWEVWLHFHPFISFPRLLDKLFQREGATHAIPYDFTSPNARSALVLAGGVQVFLVPLWLNCWPCTSAGLRADRKDSLLTAAKGQLTPGWTLISLILEFLMNS